MPDTGGAFRAELVLASQRRIERGRRKTRICLVAVAVLASVLAAGAALGAGGWLRGEPAPSDVVSDFGTYTPQLGFHPQPGDAVLVARDVEVRLYATTNREGGYCIAVAAPWKPPAVSPDGGTCFSPPLTSARFVAGFGGAAPVDSGGATSMVVVGRTAERAARSVVFTAPSGETVTRQVESSGFFVALVRLPGAPCAGGDWRPTFTLQDAHGRAIGSFPLELARAAAGGACVLAGPHAPS